MPVSGTTPSLIDNNYHTQTGWTGGTYTADLCGYADCDQINGGAAGDRVDQGLAGSGVAGVVVPDNVSSATLSFVLATSCPAQTTCSGAELRVGLWDQQGSGAFSEQDFFSQAIPGLTIQYPPQSYSLDVTKFLQGMTGQILDVYAIANSPSSDYTEWFVDDIQLSITALASPPSNVRATSTSSGEARVTWGPPADASINDLTGFSVTIYNASGSAISTQSVSASTTSVTVSGLPDGAPVYFSVASVNPVGSNAAESNSVTPLSGIQPTTRTTAVSGSQYSLPNSDGSAWQVMDESNLALSMQPSSAENVLLSVNADLWTANAGYNQDIGIQVAAGSGAPQVVAWKESGGFGGTFSPNAAFVETVFPMSAGITYSVQVVWKANRPAIPAAGGPAGSANTIMAGAGPSAPFSPTRLTATVLPAGANSTAVSTSQYSLPNSDGSTWKEMDPSSLVTSALTPSATGSVLVSGNADLWTATAGYNQDIGLFVSDNGATPTGPIAWKESGGFAGTYSPNAAFVQAVYPVTAGHHYTFSLWWKTNQPAAGATIHAGAGPSAPFSPTRITAYILPGNIAPTQWGTAVSTQQEHLANSNGSTWQVMDASALEVTINVPSGASSENVLVSANADLWTATLGYNQDVGVFVAEDGSTTQTLLGWKESGGYGGTYSPNAAFLQTVTVLQPGHDYVFILEWKTNRPAPGVSIFAGAGSASTGYSPTRLTVAPQR